MTTTTSQPVLGFALFHNYEPYDCDNNNAAVTSTASNEDIAVRLRSSNHLLRYLWQRITHSILKWAVRQRRRVSRRSAEWRWRLEVVAAAASEAANASRTNNGNNNNY